MKEKVKDVYSQPEVYCLEISTTSVLKTLSFKGDVDTWDEGGDLTTPPTSYLNDVPTDVPSTTR